MPIWPPAELSIPLTIKGFLPFLTTSFYYLSSLDNISSALSTVSSDWFSKFNQHNSLTLIGTAL
jgi:hypothetical protein